MMIELHYEYQFLFANKFRFFSTIVAFSPDHSLRQKKEYFEV